ncbi:phosphatidylglycerol lysyltransferase domain-containing protein, partial [Streptococcus pyogenes]
LYAQKEGYHFFSLGMAPLSNVGLKPTAPILERFVHLVYKYGNKFYSFSGLRRYKAKYASKWLPHYISYSPHSWLIYDI